MMKSLILSLFLLVGFFGFAETQSCNKKSLETNSNTESNVLKVNDKKHTIVIKTCAPWDGAALTIVVSDSPKDCDNIKPPYLRVTIWKSIDDVSGKTFTFPDEKLGIVSRQIADKKYVVAKSATVKFEESNDKSDVIFQIEAEFEDGEKLKDKFKAKWCESEFNCG